MDTLRLQTPGEAAFHQAVGEVIPSLEPVIDRHVEYRMAKVLERLVVPERVIQFRVTWVDDSNEVQVNRGYRVEFSSLLGPYKGGLRFHPTVDLGVLKFLGFEQIFKNSLTLQPIGGGKGGSDFNPKGKSDGEVMRFCQAFMSELYRHIGPDTDVPAGDIGVGGREIGYLYGMYRKLTNTVTGVLTGKGEEWGGSLIRPEATGYGCVYFAANMLETRDDSLEGKRCIVSGSGNVAQYATQKILDLGGTPLTFSDSSGWIYDPDGIDRERLAWVMELKNVRRGRLSEYVNEFSNARYTPAVDGRHPALWSVDADAAFPCATQNEVDGNEARSLIESGIQLVSEGANMPVTSDGQDVFLDAGILYAPGKAANAGGVAVSALEMAQNAARVHWTRDEVDRRLGDIMKSIHTQCVEAAEEYGFAGNYLHGANIAGFIRVADTMLDQGIV
jgi:glutamate dehydrogenase (NADP+)